MQSPENGCQPSVTYRPTHPQGTNKKRASLNWMKKQGPRSRPPRDIVETFFHPPRWYTMNEMSYDSEFRVLFIARIETIVTATQKNDLIISAPMVRLSNAPPPTM